MPLLCYGWLLMDEPALINGLPHPTPLHSALWPTQPKAPSPFQESFNQGLRSAFRAGARYRTEMYAGFVSEYCTRSSKGPDQAAMEGLNRLCSKAQTDTRRTPEGSNALPIDTDAWNHPLTWAFDGGRYWTRTSDLCLVRAERAIP